MAGKIHFQTTKVMKASKPIVFLRICFCSIVLQCLLLLLSCSLVFAGDYMLYLPKQVDTSVHPGGGDGVLVKKLTIKKGDTLSALSREFSGKATYFPQILLFNDIRNPNLIYAGKELLVPVSKVSSHDALMHPSSGEPATLEQKSTRLTNSGRGPGLFAERDLYERSTVLFAEGKYREALDGFNRFLKEFPSSSLAPDVTLYRGDCFLRLSEI